ncbi:MAG: ABC transporter permease subunit [Gammaproteobacteria bacterium]|nr:ABC transporter permease subunit [Gammaproteobacteria bacterium]
MSAPYHIGQPFPISLEGKHLPQYAILTTVRMFIALAFSFLFAVIVGHIAAKSMRAGKLIIPLIDILQSVPVLAYLSMSVTGFIALFPGSMWGPECAVIFVVFASQVWNMTLSAYQSFRTLPKELVEAAEIYQLSGWQRFWRLELPFAIPGLLWNAMVSMSAGWFFIVASEAISIANQSIYLPGIGSYIAKAIELKNTHAILLSIVTMLIVILLYDQLFFRPLIAWSDKFRFNTASTEAPESWFLNVLQRTQWVKQLSDVRVIFADLVVNCRFFLKKPYQKSRHLMAETAPSLLGNLIWYGLLTLIFCISAFMIWRFIFSVVPLKTLSHVIGLGALTAIRVFITIALSSLIWVPIGLYVGLRPKLAQFVQPLSQIFAAFPANLFFPVFVMFILAFHLDVNVWSILLMMVGTQWYILFNVIAGASVIPTDLSYAAQNMQLKGFLKWRRFYLPAIFPYYITGAITAAGGAWNASIVAEFVSWGHTQLVAQGLGAYVTHNTIEGNFPEIALGVVVMSFWVVCINLFFWRKLYAYAEQRYRIE